MREIAHISDLHFGREDPLIADVLLRDLYRDRPSVVVVSGDLTQRAKRKEFRAAKEFLEQIPIPKVIVPGNHDIPLYNLFGRFIKRLSRFRKNISKNIDEVYKDDELAIFGINSARSFTFKEGRISLKQIAQLEKNLAAIDDSKLKILVTHHPLPTLGRSGLALPVLEEGGIDLLLTGHIHEMSVGDLKADMMLSERSILAFGAGTAISGRTRGEPNSYNMICCEEEKITLRLRVWTEGSFRQAGEYVFQKQEGVWKRIDKKEQPEHH